jgi:tRNA(fMet)-specific endonuclease VapC
MALIYVADTNIVSEIIRPRPDPRVQSHWQQYAHQIAITAVTWHELWTGTRRLPDSKRRQALETFLLNTVQVVVPILPYDRIAAEWHANERARLSLMGRSPSFADGQIAAVAAANDLILVTRNTADFTDFVGLRVENWFHQP